MSIHLLMLNFEFPPIGGGAANAHYYLLKEYAANKELAIDVLTSAPNPGFSKETFSENITIYKVGLIFITKRSCIVKRGLIYYFTKFCRFYFRNDLLNYI